MNKIKWILDLEHSQIGFRVKHMMSSNVQGKFEKFDASACAEGETFDNVRIDLVCEIDSIATGSPERDRHLRSPDFFDSERFPSINFQSLALIKRDVHNYLIKGQLTMHGVTNIIELETHLKGTLEDLSGSEKVGFMVYDKINRKDWGLNWNSALETGGVLVGDEVSLEIELQFVRQGLE